MSDPSSPSDPSLPRAAERGVRLGVLAVLAVAVRRRSLPGVANAGLALLGTYLPGWLERRLGVAFAPWQRVYVEAAMLTHATGMLGPYEDVWWWDHLTHTHSSSILAGLVFAAARRRDTAPGPRVVAAVLVVGLGWELLEYAIHRSADRLGVEPLLVPYGRRDTALDLCFDLLGGLLVLALGDRLVGTLR